MAFGTMNDLTPIGWLTWRALQRLRVMETTFAYGRFSRLSQAAVGREWGEGEWTSRDLWERSTP